MSKYHTDIIQETNPVKNNNDKIHLVFVTLKIF